MNFLAKFRKRLFFGGLRYLKSITFNSIIFHGCINKRQNKEDNTVDWKNLDTLTSFEELSKAAEVDLTKVMAGENGAERVKKYSTPMAEGLAYNYAAKKVDDSTLEALAKLAEEAQLSEKFAALYNGEVVNTGEKRLVLHHMTRGQLGDAVNADGVDKRSFYVEQQNRIADFANKVHAGEITNAAGEKFTTVVQIGIGGSDLVLVQCILHLRTGQRRITHSKWKQNSSAMLTRMMQQQY